MNVEMVVRLTPADGSDAVEITYEQAQELYAQLGSILHKIPVLTPVDNSLPQTSAMQDAPPVPVMPSALPKAFAGKALPLQTPPAETKPENPTEAPPAG